MADLSDVQGYERKFANQLEKLEAADIDPDDRDAIRSFIRREDAQGDVNTGTCVSHLNRLRLAAERATVPLLEMDRDDVDALLSCLKREYGLSEGTRRNYRKALRVFFRDLGRGWADDIKIGAGPKRTVDPSDLLTMDEIEAIIGAARNPRDKALVGVLADTGMRISAVASLRVRDYSIEGDEKTGLIASVRPNQDAPVKGARDPVPLTWSAGYVANWLDIHPRREPDAPLFHKMKRVGDGDGGAGGDGDDDDALTYQYLGRRIRWLAEDAGVDTGRVNTHNFRKSAISRWIREGLSEQAIKHRAHWAKDSGQFATYSGVSAEEMNEDIRAHYGLATSESARPELSHCPSCRTPVTSTARYCSGCAAPLTPGAAEDKKTAKSESTNAMVEEERAEKRRAIQSAIDLIDGDPTLLDEVEL